MIVHYCPIRVDLCVAMSGLTRARVAILHVLAVVGNYREAVEWNTACPNFHMAECNVKAVVFSESRVTWNQSSKESLDCRRGT